jgi:8-oxo-dGTP pyrophosphatase MutT (NUDIX family)
VTGSRGAPTEAEARPAATVVLLRPGAAGLEVLLTQRPSSMRFGADLFVFPGGRVEAGESAAEAAARETLEETGIRVDSTGLVPMTRWVTPYGLPIRFDTRFFGVIVPPGTDVAGASDEIAAWRWLGATAALEAMVAGELSMWQPTIVTLQQLEGIGDLAALRVAFGPAAHGADARPGRRFETAWSGGIEGRAGASAVIGRRRWVVVDPGDPTSATIDAVQAAATGAGAIVTGVLVTDIDPERHAGVEMFARGLGLPVAGPPGSDGLVPYPVTELPAGAAVPWADEAVIVEVDPAAEPGVAPRRWADRAARLRLSGPVG